jgi:hypothetical protein
LLALGIVEMGISVIRLRRSRADFVGEVAVIIAQVIEVRVELIVAARFVDAWLRGAAFALSAARSATAATTSASARSTSLAVGRERVVFGRRRSLDNFFDKLGCGNVLPGKGTYLTMAKFIARFIAELNLRGLRSFSLGDLHGFRGWLRWRTEDLVPQTDGW